MKICVVTTWPPHRDGVAYYSAKLYRHVGKLTIVTIVGNYRQDQACTTTPYVKVVRCWHRGSPFYIFQIFKHVVRCKADVIHIQHGWLLYGGPITSTLLPLLLFMTRLTLRPVIVTIHTVIRKSALTQIPASYGTSHINPLKALTAMIITKLIGLFSSKVIIHNNLMREVLIREYKLKWDKIVVIAHGVDKERKSDIDKVDAISTKRRILFFGFLRSHKGLEYLVKAMPTILRENPGTVLIVIGTHHAHNDAAYVDRIKNLVRESKLGDSVIFKGFVSEGALNGFISTSDIIALPYIDDGFVEASGVLAKLMDYGKLLVCTRIPKFQGELCEGLDCIMVKPRNVEALAESISIFLNHPEATKKLGKNLKKKAKSRYWDIVATKHFELYDNIRGR